MVASLLALALTSSPGALPIPGVKGQVLDARATRFHLPQGLAQVEHFYREAFKGDVGVTLAHDHGALVIRSRRPGERWSRAVVRDEGIGTTIEVTPIIAMGPIDVRATPPSAVSLVIERSGHVQEQLEHITDDHAQR